MNSSPLRLLGLAVLAACAALPLFAQTSPPALPPAPSIAPTRAIPDVLKPWQDWVLWNDAQAMCPVPWNDPKKSLCFWPSRLALTVEKSGARWEIAVQTFAETWVPLPGGAEAWPLDVRANGAPAVVLDHGGRPSVKLAAGTWKLEGAYRWTESPQRIPLPREIGLLALSVDGRAVDAPTWDAQGFLWLRRDGAADETDKDVLSVKVFAALEDGIPMWLRTEIELTVSGKSREEDLGAVLPAGWRLAQVESPLPVAADDAGRMKAQVRAGKWTIRADAFRADNPKDIAFAPAAKPPVSEILLAFRSKPDFRLVEIVGAPSIDVSQTAFPDKWRELPVYRWDPVAPLRIEERQRGMGDQKPAGLAFGREWWLDEDGRSLTFRDRIVGTHQRVWRLDAAPGQDLGSVRTSPQGLLITRNPQTAVPGVEVRARDVSLEATGRMARAASLPATGWQTDAEELGVMLYLPPGWRLLALFGADWSRGDWLTAWTLLDLFLLMLLTLAVFRLWGGVAAAVAFLGFGLSYHEPDAPRFIWLLLLVPLALERVAPKGWATAVVRGAKWLVLLVFALEFVPFVAQQVQQAIYPQLERVLPRAAIIARSKKGLDAGAVDGIPVPFSPAILPLEPPAPPDERQSNSFSVSRKASPQENSNLQFDTKARIQTGPGVPDWEWRRVAFGWNGPVKADQTVRPILISLGVERVLTVLRVALLLALVAILFGVRRWTWLRAAPRTAAVLVALAAFFAPAAPAGAEEIPDAATLEALHQRLLEKSDAFPNAAEIPEVALALAERRITMDAEIHAAARVAVPLPGRLPAWSPVSVSVDGRPEAALRRGDGFLWVALAPGVHRVRVEGMISDASDWEWSFLLRPRRVRIEAPGWTWTGVRPDGAPEGQVFFARQQKAAATGGAAYERNDLATLAIVDRQIELGLVWQVRTTVSRLTPAGKALSLRVPLLPGENVLSANAVVRDGFIEVRLGAQQEKFLWESGLDMVNTLKLATRAGDSWVERWQLVASPVWNVRLAGLPPTFEGGSDLVPVWQPWPGESAELSVARPEAVAGATVTVDRATHDVKLGDRQRTATLTLSVRCSLGEDFLLGLPASAEVTSLTINGRATPVRQDGAKLILPLRPGAQAVVVAWKTNATLGVRAAAEEVRLPVEAANVTTTITVPADSSSVSGGRWVLWTAGPTLGPAVRFWGVLACSLLAAWALSRARNSPLRAWEWALLVIGLTQVSLIAAMAVVGWLFLMSWRGHPIFQAQPNWRFNLLQAALVLLTVIALVTLVAAVAEGLLGRPEMFVVGNGSSRSTLRWFQARCENVLPQPVVWSVSVWWYRLLMLGWALWLAASLLRWLRTGWENFRRGGFLRRAPKPLPPPAPAAPPTPPAPTGPTPQPPPLPTA